MGSDVCGTYGMDFKILEGDLKMINPPVKVEILDSKVPEVAQRLCNKLQGIGFRGDIHEITLLCSLLTQCGGEFNYENQRNN